MHSLFMYQNYIRSSCIIQLTKFKFSVLARDHLCGYTARAIMYTSRNISQGKVLVDAKDSCLDTLSLLPGDDTTIYHYFIFHLCC